MKTGSIACCLVTWNRAEDAARVLEALARQSLGAAAFDVVVVDNASDEPVSALLSERFGIDRVIDNAASDQRSPSFEVQEEAARPNALGFRSLTVIRNRSNFGGCGGFNTAMRYVARHLEPESIWLLDDDIDLDPDAGASLRATLESDPKIGLAGSRTVDLNDRSTTIETTIFQSERTGLLGPDPDESDPRRAEHDAWAEGVGGTREGSGYAGRREVDVVSACSLMARAELLDTLGFWDDRFFIYCDDADWCLRAKRAGYRVVLDLDAVAYHTPWFDKLTPVRSYYAQRNILWTIAKGRGGRRLLARRSIGLLKAALRDTEPQRAHLSRRAAHDAAMGNEGKLNEGTVPTLGATKLRTLGTALLCALAVLKGGALRG